MPITRAKYLPTASGDDTTFVVSVTPRSRGAVCAPEEAQPANIATAARHLRKMADRRPNIIAHLTTCPMASIIVAHARGPLDFLGCSFLALPSRSKPQTGPLIPNLRRHQLFRFTRRTRCTVVQV